MAFFRPSSPAALTAALAWAEANSAGDLESVWGYDGDRAAWSMLALPSPRMHPGAAHMFASATGTSAGAIAAVLERRAFVDDDGELRLWPWFPEEDAVARPVATAQAAALGIRLPREHLDEPYEPAHYLARATMAALVAWLEKHGVDARAAFVDRVPVPPQQAFAPERYEGGMKARARGMQALASLARTANLFQYVGDNEQLRADLELKLDRQLAAVCAVIGGTALTTPAREPEPIEIPVLEVEPVGRIQGVFAVSHGALLIADGALILIDRDGRFTAAWPRPMGEVFARGDIAIVNYSHALDLAERRWVAGELSAFTARMGLDALPSTHGHDERTAPELSACGRYLLDVDETPYIVRLADELNVADGSALEKSLEPLSRGEGVPKTRPGGLVAPAQVEVAKPVIIDGVRFVLRNDEPPVRDGRALAFALAGDHWRFLVGDLVKERGKVIARLGVPLHVAAFRDDGRELWALASDHAIRIELGEAPALGAIVALQPILESAARALEAR